MRSERCYKNFKTNPFKVKLCKMKKDYNVVILH